MALTAGQRVTYSGPQENWQYLCPGTNSPPQGTVQATNDYNNPGDVNVLWDVPAGATDGTIGSLSVYAENDPNLVYVTNSNVAGD